MTPPAVGTPIWTFRRRFVAEGLPCTLEYRTGLKGATGVLSVAGRDVGWDHTPIMGEAAVRNHVIRTILPSGRGLEVEAGYYNWWNVALAARVDGELIHESHPGRKIELPESARKAMVKQTASGEPVYDFDKLGANRIPIMVDISLGLFFFVVGKYLGLTEAALGGAAVGLILLAVQRATKIDLLGGLASFGIVMLLLSAGFAWFFQDDEWVKQKSTIMGLIAAGAFLTDGAFGGRWLGQGLSRYIVYRGVVPARLSLGMGAVGLIMAASNWLVARSVSTDVWLFYTTFVDVVLAAGLVIVAINWARRGGGQDAADPARGPQMPTSPTP